MLVDNKAIWKKGFQLAARWRSPRFAALLLYLTAQTVPTQSSQSKPRNRRYRMLALSINKAGFLQDVEESFLGTDEFDVVYWPTFALRIFAREILSPSLNNKHYLTDDPVTEATKREYRIFLSKTWNHLCAITPIHVVVSPNYGYFIQREFAAALEEIGTPFIVLHKENLKSPGRLEFWQRIYIEQRGKFFGRKILVYNETERDLQVRSGVTKPEDIVVTGMPRLDRIHHWRLEHANIENGPDKIQVLFFAFDKADKLPPSRGKASIPEINSRWGELSWGSLCEKTHGAIAELARQRPNVTVVVKMKANARQRDQVAGMLKSAGESLPPNLKIITGGDTFHLLSESQVVIGFNTTAQLEALAAGIPVIVPWFDEAVAPETRDFVIDLGDSVEYAYSPDQIIALACSHIDRPRMSEPELSPSVRQALRQWTGNDDGKAKRRVLDAVCSELAPGPEVSRSVAR